MSYQQDPYQQQGYGQGQQYPATPQYGQQQQHYPPPPGQGSHPQQSAYPPQHQQSYGQPSYAQPPSSGPTHQSAVPEASDSGSYRNLKWTVKHRNTNSTLNVQLGQGGIIKSKAGAMIHMSPTVTLQGKMKVSMKKLFTGGSMTESSYTGPGLVALAPTLFGDIVTLQIQQGSTWNVGKDAYLASTNDVVKDTKSQGLGKAFFSGEDLFIYNFTGEGVAWLTSFGAIETKHLGQGEQHVVDNGHLVAWNCKYAIEKAGGSGMSSMKSGEGLICRFTGPGTVYIQTRNLDDFADWVRSKAGGQS
ncbi:hypothetical protein LTR37_011228 [Vermiconidia calcicola]|uniref:Uncharacterized protein n=1 Tax=Vermiconidia calcicola TaxID=1690605 RepID=A0ACC3N4E1_9PEZI|nr:hypothetical protein LTR37_011228 [Vermiconidia calcicola]